MAGNFQRVFGDRLAERLALLRVGARVDPGAPDQPHGDGRVVEAREVEHAGHLLEASVRKMESKALMNITLIDAEKNERIWSNRLEMDLSVKELFDIQFEVEHASGSQGSIVFIETGVAVPDGTGIEKERYAGGRDS